MKVRSIAHRLVVLGVIPWPRSRALSPESGNQVAIGYVGPDGLLSFLGRGLLCGCGWDGLKRLRCVQNSHCEEVSERRRPGGVASEAPLALLSCSQDWRLEGPRGGNLPSWCAFLI